MVVRPQNSINIDHVVLAAQIVSSKAEGASCFHPAEFCVFNWEIRMSILTHFLHVLWMLIRVQFTVAVTGKAT
jgi:hypothetical protein